MGGTLGLRAADIPRMNDTTKNSVKVEAHPEDPKNLAIWHERGWTARSIGAWPVVAWGPLEAEVWVKAGYTADEVERLNQLRWLEHDLTRPQMVSWAFTGMSMDWIVLAIMAGATPAEVGALVEERGSEGCGLALAMLAALRGYAFA